MPPTLYFTPSTSPPTSSAFLAASFPGVMQICAACCTSSRRLRSLSASLEPMYRAEHEENMRKRVKTEKERRKEIKGVRSSRRGSAAMAAKPLSLTASSTPSSPRAATLCTAPCWHMSRTTALAPKRKASESPEHITS
ncbi:hypothetical protein CLOM_g2499 [Closterium sp. NIES-68]|nr:hypothetical protein CLOM_g2499 [Closterium sp. NIES-68]GJP74306.1 hypothetical protein CLOP_g4911 [Closterium sp. NIES-67]